MNLLFDLDGTLTDPGVGITRCIQHALSSLGHAVPEATQLVRFIGPPLQGTFAELLATDSPTAIDAAIGLYRERFSTVGLFENEVYPDIPEGLGRLRVMGHRLRVATSKPTLFARRIADHFGLAGFFDGLHGSELSGRRSDKAELIRHIVDSERLDAASSWMIGDRRHDVAGARANGLTSVGVLWGYGTETELREAGARHLVASMGALCEILRPATADAPAAEGRSRSR